MFETRDKVITEAMNLRDKYSELRIGQSIYNASYQLYPSIVEEFLTANEYDCFHRDQRVELFLEKLCKLVEKA